MVKKSNRAMKLFLAAFVGCVLGFLGGISFPFHKLYQSNAEWFKSSLYHVEGNAKGISCQVHGNDLSSSTLSTKTSDTSHNTTGPFKICEPSNPRGAERLPPLIIANESDLYLRRLWGNPNDDLPIKPKYLVTFTVGYNQKTIIDAAVKKFSENFTILLFHYDGRTNEWDEFEWSKQAIHISVPRQAKWWYAKRFLHPDIVAAYDYIFIWDEDLGVEHFDSEEYIKLIKKNGLEISQPALEPMEGLTWQMTMKQYGHEVHKETTEKPGWCPDPHKPPCAAFVEIMAPVFSRDAWRCVWHMIQNDLGHGWGIDFALRKCVEPAHEKIGVVDAQWVFHGAVPSLGNQVKEENVRPVWQGGLLWQGVCRVITLRRCFLRKQVQDRCHKEWSIFEKRMKDADKEENVTLLSN